MNLILRVPEATDAEALGLLHVRCWQEAYAGLVNTSYLGSLSAASRAEQWRKTMATAAIFKLVACDGGTPVGFVIAGPARPDVASVADGEIYALYLLSAYQGLGAGHALFQAALDDWSKRGGRTVGVQAIAGNSKGIAFYRRHGGIEVARGHFELGGEPLDDVTFLFATSAAVG